MPGSRTARCKRLRPRRGRRSQWPGSGLPCSAVRPNCLHLGPLAEVKTSDERGEHEYQGYPGPVQVRACALGLRLRTGPSGGLHVVDDGLDPDHPVLEDEGVDAVLDLAAAAGGLPREVEDVVVEDLVEVPRRVRDVAEELDEDLAGPGLAMVGLALDDENRVVGVVRDDLLEVLRAEGLAVVSEDLSLIHISEPTRLGMISYAVFC